MNIGVFFGSGSVEHDISIITAQLVIAGLKGLNYQVTPIYITKTGKWMIGEELGDLKFLVDNLSRPSGTLSSSLDHELGAEWPGEGRYVEYYLDMQESAGKMVFKKKGIFGKSVTIDLVFPSLHGTFGEDGTMQGLFEIFGIPYVGCGVTASAIAMDKALTKIILRDAGIPITKFVYFYKKDWEGGDNDTDDNNYNSKKSIIDNIKKNLKFPLMVKPAHLGSSIGIGKAKDEKELGQKVEVAVYYDDKVVVEEVVENLMDVTCCLIGNEKPIASELQESLYTLDLFSFEDKYLKDGGAQTGKNQRSVVIPARLDGKTTKAIKDTAMAVYRLIECSGIARVDFLVDRRANQFFVNEINPMPGTLYHHLWQASDVELPELLEDLIKYARQRFEARRAVSRYFESSVLTKLSGSEFKSNKLQI